MRLIASGATITGPRHLELGEKNQDAMGLRGWRGGWVASVADGLGSRPRSDIGSRYACVVAQRVMGSYPVNLELQRALTQIYSEWLTEIFPYSPDDSATTLLLASVSASGKVRAAQFGDGLLLVRSSGLFRCITQSRSGFGNQTHALSSVHNSRIWSVVEAELTEPGDGVVLMTDGVSDDLASDRLSEFMDALYADLSTRNRRNGRQWLKSELVDWATPMHSDDKTIVAIFRAPL